VGPVNSGPWLQDKRWSGLSTPAYATNRRNAGRAWERRHIF